MRFYYFLSLVILLFLSSCSSSNNTEITGTLKGAEDLSIYFDKVYPDGNNMSITQVPADNKGNFKFVFEEPLEEGVYRVRAGARYAHLVLLQEDKKVNVQGTVSELNKFNYQVSGSKTSEEYRDILARFNSKEISMDDVSKDIQGYFHPLISMQLNNILMKGQLQYLNSYTQVNQQLREKYPDSEFTVRHTQMLDKMNRTLAMTQRSNRGKFKVGDMAPEINLPGPDGKFRKLSDLRGEIVLIDFWASWCGPCRKDNPKLVKAYNKYKDKGFTIFSVSLDGIHPRLVGRYKTQSEIDKQIENAKKKWIAAIQKDDLQWDSHVSELKHWNSAVSKLYGVSSIPQSFLIDREGKIAAINPRYTLEMELEKLI